MFMTTKLPLAAQGRFEMQSLYCSIGWSLPASMGLRPGGAAPPRGVRRGRRRSADDDPGAWWWRCVCVCVWGGGGVCGWGGVGGVGGGWGGGGGGGGLDARWSRAGWGARHCPARALASALAHPHPPAHDPRRSCLSTVLRYKVPLILIISNNGAYSIECEIHDGCAGRAEGGRRWAGWQFQRSLQHALPADSAAPTASLPFLLQALQRAQSLGLLQASPRRAGQW